MNLGYNIPFSPSLSSFGNEPILSNN